MCDVEVVLQRNKGKQVFLVDNMWYMTKCFAMMSDLQSDRGYKTGHLYGITNFVINIKKYFPEAVIIICEDLGSNNRKELNEDYKAGRTRLFSFDKLFDFEKALLSDVPETYFCYVDNYEADDVIFSISKIKDYGNEFIIFSGDNDMLQALDDTTKIVRKIKGNLFEVEITEGCEYYNKSYEGLRPEQIPVFRAIIGDSSDNLKPIIPRFPKKIAKLYASNKLEEVKLSDKEKEWASKIINEGFSAFETNLSIMKLKKLKVMVRGKVPHKSIPASVYLGLGRFEKWCRLNNIS